MLDEICLRAVDWSVKTFTYWFAPWKVRIKRSFLGFRPALIYSSIKRMAMQLFENIKTADDEDGPLQRLLHDPVEPVNPIGFFESVGIALARANAFFAGKAFGYLLAMTMITTCLLAGQSSRALAVMAAFFCMNWLAEAMVTDYEPVCGGIRQRYLFSILLRAGAYLTLLLDYFVAYAQNGLQINVVLQATMALILVIHLILYLSFVAFNKKQQPFLRIMIGLLGVAPALASAAGVALGASMIAQETTLALSGLLRAAGATLAFIAWQIEMIDSLGGERLTFGKLLTGLPMTLGFFMMLVGAWFSAL